MKINNLHLNSRPITTGKPIDPIYDNRTTTKTKPENERVVKGQHFKDVLKSAVKEKGALRFSKHAERRMAERSINLSPTQLYRLENGIDKAQSKGVKDSLVVMKDTAFIVNVPTRTVITAVDGTSMRDNVFTNIDSAIII